MSRSTFAGTGQYGGHVISQNSASYEQMKDSVNAVFHFNAFGVPITGADICGYHGHASVELCTRWHTLGAFYPLSRNHNEKNELPQEPYMFNERISDNKETTYSDVIRTALQLKYSLARYYFSEMHRISRLVIFSQLTCPGRSIVLAALLCLPQRPDHHRF